MHACMQVRCASLLEGIEAPSPTLNECMLSTTDENNDCDKQFYHIILRINHLLFLK